MKRKRSLSGSGWSLFRRADAVVVRHELKTQLNIRDAAERYHSPNTFKTSL